MDSIKNRMQLIENMVVAQWAQRWFIHFEEFKSPDHLPKLGGEGEFK